MIRFLYGDLLWKELGRHAKKASRIKAAIAYATNIGSVAFRPGDVLIVDATNRTVAMGATSAVLLGQLLLRGVKLYCHPGLHSKTIIADDMLFASSANLSDSSVNRLFEAGIQTDSPNAVSSASGMIERLIEKSTEIDAKFIARIKKIRVVRTSDRVRSRARSTPEKYRDPITWLLGVHEIDEPTNIEELKRIETGRAKAEEFISNPRSSTGWIRWGKKDSVGTNARRGDNVIVINRKNRKGTPDRVYPHANVLHIQSEPNCNRIFYEESPTADKNSLSWAQFLKLANVVGLREPSKDARRQLADKISADLKDGWKKVRR
jgi:hypothetical protein